ncbi:hypothetical protein ABKA04_008400 [Annulohypoxylon sp. FPYF3050]
MGSRRQSFSMIGREAERGRSDPNRIGNWVNGTDSTVSASAPRSDVRSRAPAPSTVYPHSSVSGSHGGSRAGSHTGSRHGSHHGSHGHSASRFETPRTPTAPRSGVGYVPAPSSVSSSHSSRSGRSSSVSGPISFSMGGTPQRGGGRYPPSASSCYSHAVAAARAPPSCAPSTPSRMGPTSPSYAGSSLSRRSSVCGASRASGASSYVSGTSGASGSTVTGLSSASRGTGSTMTGYSGHTGASGASRGQMVHVPRGSEAGGIIPFSAVSRRADGRPDYAVRDGEALRTIDSVEKILMENGDVIVRMRHTESINQG